MTFLDELEKRVLQIVQKNSDLQHRIVSLEQEISLLKEKGGQMEVSLLRESEKYQVLLSEKDLMRSSVEQLLNSIKALEEAH